MILITVCQIFKLLEIAKEVMKGDTVNHKKLVELKFYKSTKGISLVNKIWQVLLTNYYWYSKIKFLVNIKV